MPDKIDQLCHAALQAQADDLFLKTYEYPCIRVAGRISALGDAVLTQEDLGEFWVACGCDPATVQDMDLSWTSGQGQRFRVNLFRHVGRLGAALRPIKNSVAVLDALGLPGELLRGWANRPEGVILVCGGTGCGKSTTIASLLDWVNRTQTKHIVTIEDPIEYLLDSNNSVVTQREVGMDTESFTSGLRSALRQSPDIIFVGEIRDRLTAETALQAAETGHLVVSTLHSSDAEETFDRLLALFPKDEQATARLILSKQLVGVLCQKLVPAVSGGLTPVVEHIEVAGAIRQWIRSGTMEKIPDLLNREPDAHNRPFLSAIKEAYESGRISAEAARSICSTPSEFDRLVSGIRSSL